jgi:ribosomal protein S18 acetylase RimI-like enzyme
MKLEILEADPTLPAHATAMVELLHAYASGLTGGGQGLASEVRQQLPAALANRSNARIVLAWVDDCPAGLIIAFEGFSTFQCRPLLNLHDVVVAEKFRGLGISKHLLAKAEEIAARTGCCKVTLEVLEGNHIARSLYEKQGYSGYALDPALGKALFWEKKLLA